MGLSIRTLSIPSKISSSQLSLSFRRATRIFNPVLQMERYDPQAEYVRRWVPEYGTSRYPKPIVPHNEGRDEFLRRFATTAGGREAIRAARREEAEIAKRGTKQGSGRGQKKLF